MSARWRGEHILPPKNHVTRNRNISLSGMDIDGDALLGLIEKGGSELAAQLIPMLDTG